MVVKKVITIRGRVQGVGFRYFTAGIARRFELNGTVVNLRDGSVEVIVEGNEETVRSFIDRLKEGPPASKVDGLTVRDEKPTGDMSDFEIVIR